MACEGLMKIFLGILNIIFFILGAATLALSIWIKVDKNHLLDLTKDVSGTDLEETDIPSLLDNAVVALMIIGSFIFLLGFLGCCGTLQSKTKTGKFFLKVYSTIVLLLLIVELSCVCVIWQFFDKVELQLQEYLDNSLQNIYNGSFSTADSGAGYIYSSGGNPITLAWDIVQLQFECCGRTNGADYASENITWHSYRGIDRNGVQVDMNVPPTCCDAEGGNKALSKELKKVSSVEFALEDALCPFSPPDHFQQGCYDEVKDAIKSNSVIFIAAGCTTFVVEILCIIFSCCLSKRDSDKVETFDTDDEQ